VRNGTTWDTLARGDQEKIYASAGLAPTEGSAGGVSIERNAQGKWRPEQHVEGFEANYGEGMDAYGDGTYTSPGWVHGLDIENAVGGSVHRCVSIYNPAVSDVAGLSTAQVAAVMAYNQC
jgi:hypothetical protein